MKSKPVEGRRMDFHGPPTRSARTEMKLWKQSLRVIKTRYAIKEVRVYTGEGGGRLSMMSASTKKCKKRNTPWSLCVLPFSLPFPLSLSLFLFPFHERDSIESDFMLVAGNIKSHLSTFYVGRLIISDNWLWLLPSTSHPPPPPPLPCPRSSRSIVVSFSSLCLHLSALNGDRSRKPSVGGQRIHPWPINPLNVPKGPLVYSVTLSRWFLLSRLPIQKIHKIE